MKKGDKMIELKNVSKFYTNNGVVTLGLRNINLKLNLGEIVAITGDSGSGKSTLLNVITAVDTYEEGEIYFNGNETSYFNQNDMDVFRKNNVSFIFQNYNIIDSYTVLQNVMLPLLLRGKSNEEAKTEAKKIIEKVGLSKRIHHRGTKLSGGEKQRCVIARALASDSKILACDEPTGNLDSQTGEEIIKLIKEVSKDRLVLIVTHNYNQIKDIATRRIKISDGEIVEDVYLKEEQQEKENSVYILEDQGVKKSSYFKIAIQNVLSTPKKTIFTLLVFLVISFISLLLLLMMMQQSYDTYSATNTSYHLRDEDRLIVYDKNHQPLNQDILLKTNPKDIYYNAFYEEVEINVKLLDYYQICLITKHRIQNELIAGNTPMKDGEYLVVLPDDYYEYPYIQAIDTNFFVENSNEPAGTIVGVGKSDTIAYPYLVCYEEFSPLLLGTVVQNLEIKTQIQVEGEEKILSINTIPWSNEKTCLKLPSSYQDKQVVVKQILKELYPIQINYEVDYDDTLATPIFYIGYASAFPSLMEEIYEAVLYTDHVKTVKAQLEQAGYHISVPSDKRSKAGILNLAVLYMFLALVILALICLFFISYIILSRIYSSKNKDYGVLRTLGMVKKQLGRIVIMEVMSLGIMAAILSLVVFIILYHTTTAFGMGKFMNAGVLFLYFVAMLLFSYFIARRFNRRLFKFSVNTTMKGEVARND